MNRSEVLKPQPWNGTFPLCSPSALKEGNILIQGAKKQGWSWFRIYLALAMAEKRGDSPGLELPFLLLHILIQAGSGHVRSDLQALSEEMPIWFLDEEGLPPPEMSREFPARLAACCSKLIQENPRLFQNLPSEDSRVDSLPFPRPPFVLTPDGRFVYLLRRRRQEDFFLASLESRLGSRRQQTSLFPLPSSLDTDSPEGKLASLLCQGQRFLILAGGPGTGKTRATTQLLRLLHSGRREAALPPLNFALAAPTGRAAARLVESLDPDLVSEASVSTLHSLIGLVPNRPPLYGSHRTLERDLVVVDEASMVELSLMNHLLKALPPRASLVLVGDPDQLPSVGVGALLGDLLAGSSLPGSPLAQNVLKLTKVYRSNKAILQGAAAVKAGDSKALEALASSPFLLRRALPRPEALAVSLAGAYDSPPGSGEFSSVSVPEKDLEAWFQFYENLTVLSPLRRGSYGVEALNRRIKEILGRGKPLLGGMPIILTGNDRERGFSNGDRGLILLLRGVPKVFFRVGNAYRSFPLATLPGWEAAWVQTIHKSQGSEFNKVIIVLPETAGELLTREILYTALTRARSNVELLGSSGTLDKTLRRKVLRNSRIQRWAEKTSFQSEIS